MEHQKGVGRIDVVATEPGSRYAARRVEPRQHTPGTSPDSAQAITTPATHKHLDVKPSTAKTPRKAQLIKPALPRTAKSMVLRRQMVERAKKQRQKNRKKYGKHIIGYVIAAAVIVATILTAWTFRELLPFNLPFTGQEKSNQPVNRPIVQETSSLDETMPSSEEIAAHRMGANEPRAIRIPKLGVEAKIKRVGMSLSGEPIAPGNIFDVGWFEASGQPGSPGVILLNGHVAGPTKSGIFGDLVSLEPDDKILVDRGDGQVMTYIVSRVQEYSATQVDMSAASQSLDPSRQGLNLITTTNKFSNRNSLPDKRVIVFALQ